MTKPRLVKVRALFYVLQQVMKIGCAYFDTASFYAAKITNFPLPNKQMIGATASASDYFDYVKQNTSNIQSKIPQTCSCICGSHYSFLDTANRQELIEMVVALFVELRALDTVLPAAAEMAQATMTTGATARTKKRLSVPADAPAPPQRTRASNPNQVANGKLAITELHNVISLRYLFIGGRRNVKLLASGECRRVRDCCIFRFNSLEVFL